MAQNKFWLTAVALLMLPLAAAQLVAAQAKQPALVIQQGHFTNVQSIAYNADESLIASASDDGAIKIWAADSGVLLRTLNANSGRVYKVAFSPDGQTIAAGTSRGELKFWQLESGALVRTIKVESIGGAAIAFSPDWTTVAAGTASGLVTLWDTQSGAVVRRIRAADFLNTVGVVTFSPDGKLLATGSQSKVIKLWDVATGNELRTLSGHGDDIVSVAFSPDNTLIASASGSILAKKDNSVRVWDVATGTLLHTLSSSPAKDAFGFTYPIARLLAFSSNSKFLLTGGMDDALKLWEVSTGKLSRTLKERFYTNTIAISPSWRTFASFSYSDSAVELWETQSATVLRKFAGEVQSVSMLTFSPDGKRMAIALGNDDTGSVKGFVWEFQSGPMAAQPISFQGSPHLVFKSDGLMSAGVDLSGRITVGRPAEPGAEKTINQPAPNAHVQRDALSPDGQILAVVDDEKEPIKLWDLRQGKLVHKLSGHANILTNLVFSPDGRQLATTALGDRTIKLWDTHAGQLLRSLEAHTSSVTAVAFTPDGNSLISGSSDYLVDRDHSVKLWDVKTGQAVRTFEGHLTGVTQLAVAPDGNTFASTGRNGEIKVWELKNGSLSYSLAPNAVDVSALAFHPGGKFLAVAGADGMIKILSAKTGSLIATIIAFNDANWLITSPAGFFDGTAPSFTRIQWRFTASLLDILPVEIFFNEFYHPDLMADLIGERQLEVSGDIAAKDRRQPKLKLLAPEVKSEDKLTERNLRVKIDVDERAADKDHKLGSGAQDLRLFRNGSVVKVWHGDVLNGKRSVTLEAVIPIVAGENKLTAYAFNHDNIKSSDATLVVNGAPSLKREGTAYIVSIGVNEYSNAQYNLRYAVADAEDFAAEVKRQQDLLRHYARVEVIALSNSTATKANITQKLSELATRVQPEDAVFVYFAGHGTAQGNQFYLIPHDLGYSGARDKLDETGLQIILDHSVSDRELEKLFEKIDAGQLLLVIDACNSGQALEAEEKRRGPMNSKGLAQLAYEKGMYVMTAAQSYQAAQEAQKLGHGYLTFALVESGLKQGAADLEPRNDTIDIREWLNYATGEVPRMQEENSQRALAGKGRYVIFVGDGTGSRDAVGNADDNIQRPRIFYRREPDTNPLVIGLTGAALLPE